MLDRIVSGLLLALSFMAIWIASGIVFDSHSNPLCPRCESEYERGWGDAHVALQGELARRGFAEFDEETGEWHPVRVVTLESLLKEKNDD